METRTRRNSAIALALMLCAAALVLWLGRSRVRPGTVAGLQDIPETLGDWRKVSDISFEDRVLEILGTNDVIGKIYRNTSGDTVQMVVVHAVNNRSAFHPPEYCLRGAGSDIVEKRVRPCPLPDDAGFGVNEMVLSRKSGKHVLAWNWYASGKTMTPNFYRQQLRLISDEAFRGVSRGALITVYTDIDGSHADSGSRSADFIKALVPALKTYL